MPVESIGSEDVLLNINRLGKGARIEIKMHHGGHEHDPCYLHNVGFVKVELEDDKKGYAQNTKSKNGGKGK